jgi:carbon storage regulator
MLVLSRKRGEKVCIGNEIVVTVAEIRGDRVRLGFECPPQIPVHREEVYRRIREEQTARAPGELVEASQESHYYAEFA